MWRWGEVWPVPGTNKQSAPFLHPSQGLVSLLHLGVDGVQVVLNPVDLFRLGVEHVQGVLSRGLALKTFTHTSVKILWNGSPQSPWSSSSLWTPATSLSRSWTWPGISQDLSSCPQTFSCWYLWTNTEENVEVQMVIYQTKTPTCTVSVLIWIYNVTFIYW